jgi:hypothetical protein
LQFALQAPLLRVQTDVNAQLSPSDGLELIDTLPFPSQSMTFGTALEIPEVPPSQAIPVPFNSPL